MRHGTIAGALLLLIAGADSAGAQTLERAVLDQLKDSSVFVKIRAGRLSGGGSGLVVKSTADSVLVLTNHHVAVPDADELPKGSKLELSVVLRSGTPQEQELPATVVGALMTDVEDLALVEVKGVRQPPRPIVLEQAAAESALFETMPVFALGFPLGQMLGAAAGGSMNANPSITVTSMSIGSLRRSSNGQMLRVQLNGPLIQGNSGGPIVDSKGKLVGVAVSRVRGESVGFAIPPSIINRFVTGYIAEPSLAVVALGADSVDVRLTGKLGNHFGYLKSVALRRVPAAADAQPGSLISNQSPLLQDPAPVVIATNSANVDVQFRVPLPKDGSRKVAFQEVMTDNKGTSYISEPSIVAIPDRVGPIVRPRSGGGQSTPTWSCEVNLANGCTISKGAEGTAMELPGGLPLINSPRFSSFSAPAALAQVRGDFTAAVLVDGRLDPGGEPIVGSDGKKLKMSFQGGGLLIWQDENNFVRMERAKESDGPALIHEALVEVYKGGKMIGRHYMEVPDGPILVAARRQGASIQMLYSVALEPPKFVVLQELALDFQDQLFVGVSGSNLSKRPLKLAFKNFQLAGLDKEPIEIKPVKKTSLVEPGYEKLTDGTILVEGAAMKILKEKGASAVTQADPKGDDSSWSGGRQLMWRASKKGDELTLEFPVPEAATYDVKILFTKGPDYGKVSLGFDSKSVQSGKMYDLYATDVQVGRPLSLGVQNLAKGPHKIQVNVLGKNDSSSGFAVGIDDVRLVPAKSAAATKSATTKPK